MIIFICWVSCNSVNGVTFQVTVDPPIRQGGMKYPHIVMHFKKDEKVPTIPITLPA